MKKIYLTERQFDYILREQILNEGVLMDLRKRIFSKDKTTNDITKQLISLITAGLITFSIAIDMVNSVRGTILDDKETNEIVNELGLSAPQSDWVEVCNDAIITVYNAKEAQCNNDVNHTASMFKLDLNNVGEHKIVAMERTFMKELGLKYGDIIKIVGTYRGAQDGIYQIQDTMNKRFAGQHKIDVLVPDSVTYGGTYPGKFAKIYILKDKNDSQKFLNLMAPQANE